MTYDHELTLFSIGYVQDDWGNWVPGEVERKILCSLKGVTKNEFYSAAQSGMKPELVVVINKYDYQNEQKVEFEGIKYKVIRTFPIRTEELELTCERVAGDG